jgi:predicted N-acetyltransferase YhbS
MCVLPEEQRQGIGSKLMEWGVKQMDARDIEGFVEASAPGRRLYRKFGFLDVAYVRVNMDYTAMWRPRQGNLPATEAKQIWNERLRAPVRNFVQELM